MQTMLQQPYHTPSSLLRIAVITLLGSGVTFTLFVIMAKLIEQDNVRVAPVIEDFVPAFILEPEEQTTIVKTKIKPMEQTPPPPTIPPEVPAEPENVVSMNWQTPGLGKPTLVIDNTAGGGISDQSARPIVQIQPAYPPEAARDGIEGWVSLQFTIDAAGNVVDITIIDAEPKRTFDREAKRALSKWKYQPTVVDGKPQPQPNMRVMLSFNLES